MEEHRVIKITNRWLLIITVFLILVTIGLVRYIIYKNTLFNKKIVYNTETAYRQDELHENNIDETKTYSQIKSYSATIGLNNENEKEYNIGDDFSVKVKIGEIEDNIVNYSFKIKNSEYIYSDTIKVNEEDENFRVTIYQVGDYFVFENTGKKDYRDTHIFVFDKSGNLYKDIYSIGNKEDKDMYIESVKFSENEMIINTTRITNDYQILYDDKLWAIGEEESNNIPDNTVVKIQYKYVVNRSGSVNFLEPDRKVLDTYGDFKKRNI